jgi:hypothetical protein
MYGVIFEFHRYSVKNEWWEVGEDYNEEFHYLYVSPNIVRVIRTRMMRWVGHVGFGGEMNLYKILVGKLRKKRSH